ncbi:hypothetical protein ACIQVR_19690 [Streptomyces xanthochromogenes]|uniref:hypothetical protein n=1 Tax=Streptomyces xanthochromogenes TaxID=67384 RepID=UPI00381C8CC9
MTELSTEPVVAPATTDTPPTPTPPPETPAQTAADIEHTPGGWPVVPLALSGANTTVSVVAAAGIAGGPIAAAVAATGAAVLGTVASYRSRNPRPMRAARRAAARTAGRNTPTRNRSGGLNTTGRAFGSAGRRTAGGSGRVPGQKRGSVGVGGLGRSGAGKHRGPVSLNKAAGLKNGPGAAGGALRKASQVKALREAQKAAGGSRGEKRAQTTAARRAVADARRDSPKTNARYTSGNNRPGAGSTRGRGGGLAGRMLGGAGRKARAVRDAAIAKHRARRDANTGKTLAGQRSAVRKAPARQAARKALRRSAARFNGRRILAALLALPLGLLGCVTSPLGRKLGLPWLVHPGRRLYRRMTEEAAARRFLRDDIIRDDLATAEDAADKEAAQDTTDGLGTQVERPDQLTPVPETPVSVEDRMTEFLPGQSGFRFEEVAEEMYQAAHSYDPDGCMEILSMVIGLPWALMAVANTFQKLAERSDSEFPLEKEVAEGFTGVFQALMKAVEEAEDLVPTFKRVHEQDIARHEDPRNGPEAEKGWNV